MPMDLNDILGGTDRRHKLTDQYGMAGVREAEMEVLIHVVTQTLLKSSEFADLVAERCKRNRERRMAMTSKGRD